MVDIQYYTRIFEESQNLEINDRSVESLLEEDELDADFWYRFNLKGEDKKFRITITEDYSPKFDMANYEVKISEKKPLKTHGGWTNWMRLDKNQYENLRDPSYKQMFLKNIYSELPVEQSEISQYEIDSF